MTTSLSVFEPIAPFRTEGQQKRLALDTLKGKVVGFVDNTKPNFRELADDIAELLLSRHGVQSVVRHRKRGPSVAAGEDVYKDLLARCNLVITGSGD